VSSFLLVNGDARRLPFADASVDAVVCDPPYGTEARMDGYGRSGKKIANDCSLAVFRDALPELYRVLRHSGMLAVWMAPTEAWECEGYVRAAGFFMWGALVWDKGVMGMGYRIRYSHESILVAGKQPEAPMGGLSSVQRAFPPSRLPHATGHPHEKPTAISAALIRYGTPAGGVVLDAFCGSGATLVAAREEGRIGIGIDVDDAHLRTAQHRILNAPLSLFGGAA
jgi:adenine-specific DNA-methyltransferase